MDYYKILGVSRGDSDAQVKRAYVSYLIASGVWPRWPGLFSFHVPPDAKRQSL